MEVADPGHDRHGSDLVQSGDGQQPGHHRIGMAPEGKLLSTTASSAR
jgi:hypothetical protein